MTEARPCATHDESQREIALAAAGAVLLVYCQDLLAAFNAQAVCTLLSGAQRLQYSARIHRGKRMCMLHV